MPNPRVRARAALAAALVICIVTVAGAQTNPPQPPPPVIVPPIELRLIDSVTVGIAPCDTCAPVICPGVPVPVRVSGHLPPCYRFLQFVELQTAGVLPAFAAEFRVDSCATVCPQLIAPWSGDLLLPAPPPGPHAFTLVGLVSSCADTAARRVAETHDVSYEVAGSCVPPPVDSLVRTFTSFEIVPEQRCPGDSLSLRWVTNGCPPCVDLESLSLTRVRGLVATMTWRPQCVEFACLAETLSLGLGRFAAGTHELRVSTDVRVLDTANPDSLIRFDSLVRFEIPQTCDSTIRPCVFPYLGSTAPAGECAVRLPPGGTGPVTLTYRSDLALGGVQGALSCSPPFRVSALRPPPGRPGVHVTWQTLDGREVRFVLFTEPGVVLPAGEQPLMTALLAADSSATPGVAGALFGMLTLAATPDGGAAPLCDVRAIRVAAVRLCVSDSSTCDANADGQLDVRDLVLMTRCLRQVLAPADSARLCHDCDQDGHFSLTDLLCCAHEILGGPGVPRDSVHTNDQLHVTLEPIPGDPDATALRVRVTGVRSLGAAMLRLTYPAGRWRAGPYPSMELGGASASEWLPIVDTDRPGVVSLGALRLADGTAEDLEFELRFFPLAPESGDRLTVEGAELVAGDGSVLTPAAALPATELGSPGSPPAAIALSASRPNPFHERTRFTVSLPRAARLQLTVHDVAGRLVASLASGTWPAGRHEFEWRGAGVRDGLYFVRLTVEGRTWSTRAVLMSGGR